MARKIQRDAAAVVRSSDRVPHRSGKTSPGRPGGSLAEAVLEREVLDLSKRWGVIIRWASLGQKFLWFVKGTARQKARPVVLAPDVAALQRELEADALRHYGARAKAPRRRA
ncbi:MAG TPA: hypothetical protein VEA38_16850 [Terriglobales bacterium]|nr:hypothetical protein [Terriglobales bacterium]